MATAGELGPESVIHAVGPMMGAGDGKLCNATLDSLELAEDHKWGSIAFPAISTVGLGSPVDSCALVMISATVEFLKSRDLRLKVFFCLYDYEGYDVFEMELGGVEE